MVPWTGITRLGADVLPSPPAETEGISLTPWLHLLIALPPFTIGGAGRRGQDEPPPINLLPEVAASVGLTLHPLAQGNR